MRVTVYTSNNCPACIQVKNLLKENGVEYSEKNISNPEVLQELVEKYAVRSVPVTEIEAAPNVFTPIVGFRKDTILDLIKKGEE
jgi:glutaredoxin